MLERREAGAAGGRPLQPVASSANLAERLAGAAVRRPWLVVAIATLVTVLGGWYAATHFAITTDTRQLVASNAPWRQDESAYRAAFPQLQNVILAVVQGETAELTDAAAAKLSDALSAEAGQGPIQAAWRPDGGPFFNKNGLLFLPPDQVHDTLDQTRSQVPLLLVLQSDPSLRGWMRLIEDSADHGSLGTIAPLANELRSAFEQALHGERAHFSWRRATSAPAASPSELIRFVLIDPALDYSALEPAAAATGRIRQVAADLGLTPDQGYRVRLTGAAPLADEEFATVREGAPLHLGLTVVAIAVILYLALRWGRIIFAVLTTTLVGLVLTVAAGLLMVGRFNVISVAVTALFLGLGVDFGIQLAVRYRDERHKNDHSIGSILASARGMGWSLILAAASLVAGFFSFLPTAFRGVSELGLIAGVGMIIAFVVSLTLLPALLRVLGPPREPRSMETRVLAAIDHWILRHRPIVIGATAVLVLAGLPFLFKLDFDANLMHLRSDKTESVATFLDLTRQPGMTPNTISILASSVDEAKRTAERLRALPEVSRVATVESFIPDQQDEKLAAIKAAVEQLSETDVPPRAEPPTDVENREALRAAAAALRRKNGDDAGKASGDARQPADAAELLADAASLLAGAPAAQLNAAQTAVAEEGAAVLARGKAMLTAQRVTLDNLPDSLRRDWVTPDGKARIEVWPKGDANDNTVLARFVAAVRAVAPKATGGPIISVESGRTIVEAFLIAGGLALASVFVILTIALRRPIDVALTLGPLVIATILTLETAYLVGMPLNFANIIALPLMLAVGVAFHIYYIVAWRAGVEEMLASSLTRAIFFSSLTTGVAFGSLSLSNHPGTASMGKLLTLSLLFTLLAAFVVVPAFLGPPRRKDGSADPKPAGAAEA